jgi:uncharacterized protein with FMN-binding domain
MNRTIPAILSVIGLATPAVLAPAEALAATSYQNTTSFQYGALRLTITVKTKRLKTLKVEYAPESPRSQQLDAYALPILRQEALKASSYKVHGVTGVTFTSMAFERSLYGAMLKAHLA